MSIVTFPSLNNKSSMYPLSSEANVTFLGKIFSFLDVPHHGLLVTVCKTFYAIVNSGIEEGKNARNYLLGKLDVERIHFRIGVEDLLPILYLDFDKQFSYLHPEQLKSLRSEVLQLLSTEMNEKIDQLSNYYLARTKKIMRNFVSNDDEVNNQSLASSISDPASLNSQAFFKNLALKYLQQVPLIDPEMDNPPSQLFSDELAAKMEQLFQTVPPPPEHPNPVPLGSYTTLQGMLTEANIPLELREQFHLTGEQIQRLVNGEEMFYTTDQAGVAEALNALLLHPTTVHHRSPSKLELAGLCCAISTIICCQYLFFSLAFSLLQSQNHTDL